MSRVTILLVLGSLAGAAFGQAGLPPRMESGRPRHWADDLREPTNGFHADDLIICWGEPKKSARDLQSAASSTQQVTLGRFALQRVVQFQPPGQRPLADNLSRRQLLELEREQALQRQLPNRQPDQLPEREELSPGESFYDEQVPMSEQEQPRQILSMSRPDLVPTRFVTTGHASQFAAYARPIARRVPSAVPHCASGRSRSMFFPATDMQYLLMVRGAMRR